MFRYTNFAFFFNHDNLYLYLFYAAPIYRFESYESFGAKKYFF